jgi:hypothetical protein
MARKNKAILNLLAGAPWWVSPVVAGLAFMKPGMVVSTAVMIGGSDQNCGNPVVPQHLVLHGLKRPVVNRVFLKSRDTGEKV